MDMVSTFDERPIYFKSREHTPTTTTTDVNFNSPGHRSSQDGSFIQDEDMHLILEFGPPKSSCSDLNQLQCSPASVSTSWRGRNAEWATNFDVNVAELDFDDFSASRDISTLKGARYADDGTAVTTTMPSSFGGYLRSKIYDLQRSKISPNNAAADCNHNKINKRLMMRNSMEISFGINDGSMFSSSGGGLLCDENVDRRLRRSIVVDDSCGDDVDIDNGEALILDRRNGGALAFISTDSLDLSSLSVTEENLKAVCATKKREYVLTFDKTAFESGVGVFSSVNFDDTVTNYVDGNVSSFERSTYDNDYDSQFYNYYRPAEQADGGDCGFTTWDRVKRSYEMGGPQLYMGSSKCTSLPNLNPSPIVPQRLFIFDGAEEKMASNNNSADDDNNCAEAAAIVVTTTMDGVQEMSLSASSKAWNRPTSIDNDEKRGFSLLEAFRNKCSPILYGDEKLTVPDQNIADISNDSSGYVTGGTGSSSQQGYCTTTANARKFTSSPNLASDKQLTSSKNIVNDDYNDSKNNQNTNYRPQFVLVNDDDYEYGEFFINGRYIDVNHNEIGYVPPSTTSVQRSSPVTTVWASTVSSRRPSSTSIPPMKPPRTFATLLEQNGININDYVAASHPLASSSINYNHHQKSNSTSDLKDSSTQIPVYVVDQSVQTSSSNDGGKLITVVTTSVRSSTTDKPSYVTRTVAVSPPPTSRNEVSGVEKHFETNNYLMPDLSFMKFPFIMPPLNPTLTPFLLQFLGESPTLGDVLEHTSASSASSLNKPKLATTTSFHLSQHNFNNNNPFSLPDPPKLLSPRSVGERHDSGLGGSSSGAVGASSAGPAHIQDWESLAMLLPKDVVQACSFFKANTNLLRSIDKPPRGKSTQRSPTSASKRSSSSTTPCRGGYQYLPRKSRQFASEPSSLKHCNRFESIAEEIEYCPVCQQKQQQQCGGVDDDDDRCDSHRCRYQNNCQRNIFSHNFCCNLSSDSIHHTSSPSPRRRRHNNDQRSHRREFASLTTSSRPTWCHQTPVCRQNNYRTCCSCVVNSTWKSNYCCQNDVNVCKCRSCDDGVDDFRRVTSSSVWCNNVHQRRDRMDQENFYHVEQPSSYDEAILLRSEFCCRPQIDLTDVQKFYSLPNFNIISNAGMITTIADDDDGGSGKACATCYRVRSPSAERRYQDFFCDCRTSDIIEKESYHICSSNGQKDEMNLEENCENLKALVSHIVDCCVEVLNKFAQKSAEKEADYGEDFNGAVGAIVFNSLCPSVEALLTDGLLEGRYLWMIVQSSVMSVPTDQSIYKLVRTLGSTEGNSRERSLQFATFISGLLNLRLFHVWLTMVIRNESTLIKNYSDTSYVRLLDNETVNFLLDVAKRLNVLPFERLGLIDVGFLSSVTNDNRTSTTLTATVNENKFYQINRPKDLKSIVSLQKEIRFMFCAPVTELTPAVIDGEIVNKFPENSETVRNIQPDDEDDEIYVSMSESKKYSLIPKSSNVATTSTPKLNASSRSSSSKSSSVDGGSSFHIGTTMTTPSPTKKSRIPLLMKTKLTSPTEKNNLHITITNQTTKNYTKNDQSSSSNGKHFTYDKSYVCTVEKFVADRNEFLSFDAGETLILLEEYPNGHLKCDRRGVVGLVQRDKITYISFL